MTRDEGIEKIKYQLSKINNKIDRDISFLGLVEDKWIGNKTKLILHCNIHNTTWSSTSYNNFMKPTFRGGCVLCKNENTSNRQSFSAKEAYEKVIEVHRGDFRNYDYSPILNTFSGYHNKVDVICPKHGKFSVNYSTLLIGPNKGVCPECFKEELSARETIDIYSKDILDKISDKIDLLYKYTGVKLEFLGYTSESRSRSTAKLILKCTKHNVVWDTTSLDNFINFNNIHSTFCPECNNAWKSNTEILVGNLIKQYYNDKINPQFKIDINENNYCSQKLLIVDYFLGKDKIIIEYDGQQHYEYCEFMQKTYSRFIDQVNRDNYLVQYCKDNNIRLLRISYKDNNRLEEVIKAFLVDGIDISTKVEPKLLPVPITYYKSDYGR